MSRIDAFIGTACRMRSIDQLQAPLPKQPVVLLCSPKAQSGMSFKLSVDGILASRKHLKRWGAQSSPFLYLVKATVVSSGGIGDLHRTGNSEGAEGTSADIKCTLQ